MQTYLAPGFRNWRMYMSSVSFIAGRTSGALLDLSLLLKSVLVSMTRRVWGHLQLVYQLDHFLNTISLTLAIRGLLTSNLGCCNSSLILDLNTWSWCRMWALGVPTAPAADWLPSHLQDPEPFKSESRSHYRSSGKTLLYDSSLFQLSIDGSFLWSTPECSPHWNFGRTFYKCLLKSYFFI